MLDKDTDFVLQTIEKLQARAQGKRAQRPSCQEIRRFLDAVFGASCEDFNAVFDLLEGKVGLLLITYTTEFIAEMRNSKNPELFEYALLLHRLEGFRYDPRENFRYLLDLLNFSIDEGFDLGGFFKYPRLFDKSEASKRLQDWMIRST